MPGGTIFYRRLKITRVVGKTRGGDFQWTIERYLHPLPAGADGVQLRLSLIKRERRRSLCTKVHKG